MKSRRKRPGFWLAWVDMLMAQLATFAALFLLSVFLINPPTQVTPGVEQKAEFMITLTWPKSSFDDLDLHLLLPDTRQVNFRSRQQGYAMLDQDDMGTNNTYVGTDGQEHLLDDGHRETITIRAVVPGTYTANVHVYRVRTQWGTLDGLKLPYNAHVTLTKLNPTVQRLASVDVPLDQLGQQRTAFSFIVAENGEASVDVHADVPFIPTRNFGSDNTASMPAR